MSKDMTRRSFIKKTAVLGSGAVLLSSGTFIFNKKTSASNDKKVKYGMVIDNTKCISCGACITACQDRWGLPENESFIKLYNDADVGTQGGIKVSQCMHCENAPCVRICPTQATYINEDGIVVMDGDKCVGCKGCIVACPYNARIWSDHFGYPEKCRLCDGYVQKGEQPACVEICPVDARTFGDLNDENSEISQLIKERRPNALKAHLGTKPKIYYITQQ